MREYQWDFMNDGAARVEEAGLDVSLYEKALNAPEAVGDAVWQAGGTGFPSSPIEAAEAIRALAASLTEDAGFAARQTIDDLALWIERRLEIMESRQEEEGLAVLRAKKFMLKFLEASLYYDGKEDMARAARIAMRELERWLEEKGDD